MVLHLIKLCVGCDTVEALLDWRRGQRVPGQPWVLRTRQTPKRAEELTEGGSLYRVYKGFILSRQAIFRVDTVGVGPVRRCEIMLCEDVALTVPTPRRPFQGWRYLTQADAPADLEPEGLPSALPGDLARRLREFGVL